MRELPPDPPIAIHEDVRVDLAELDLTERLLRPRNAPKKRVALGHEAS